MKSTIQISNSISYYKTHIEYFGYTLSYYVIKDVKG